jgi:hypothetical protein
MEDFRPMLLRAVRVLFASAVVLVVAVPACGNTTDSAPTTMGGSGGSGAQSGGGGTSARAGAGGTGTAGAAVTCGAETCKSVTIAIPGASALSIPGCCSDASSNTCGLDSTFLAMFGPTFPVACQPLAQPGMLDAACPDSPMTPVTGTSLSIHFPGCCRAGGTCGYQLDTIGGLIHLGLGCVDSTPFLEGGAPLSCATGSAGAGQGGGAGEGPSGESGAPGAAGETAAGGASSG